MSTVVIELKTSAPVVTWGDPDVAEAGLELAVPYDTTEVVRAEVRLADGRVLEMVVTPDRLTVMLPDDVTDGLHMVAAFDDVGNAALHQLHITGVIPTPQRTYTAGGAPVPGPIRSSWRSEVSFRSHTTIRSQGAARSRVRPTSRTTRRDQFVSHRATVLLTSSTRIIGSARSPATALALTTTTAIERTRPEGPDSDDGLVILGLL